MRQADSQSGNETYEEPLRLLLISAFAPMKEVEPDYVQSSRAGARKGVCCKDSASESEGDDDSQDGNPDGAVASEPKKSKRISVKVNKTGIERITETVNKQHAEQMAKSDTMLGFMGELVKMQKVKMMQELGVPVADILKHWTYNCPVPHVRLRTRRQVKGHLVMHQGLLLLS